MAAEGISKTMFIGGLVVAILASSFLSTAVSMNYARGPKGDKGDTGSQGSQGIQGIQGPVVNFTIGNITGWLPAPAYDSGWMMLWQTPGDTTLNHSLNTTKLLVYIIGKDSAGYTHQNFLDSGYQDYPYWQLRSENSITISWPYGGYGNWNLTRVMLWKIA